MSRAKPKAKVLVVAREPVIAALLGMLLQSEDFEPAYLDAGERPEDALIRCRPPFAAVLLDGAQESASSDLFFARAARAGARVVLFGPADDGNAIAAAARARGAPYCAMPCSGAALGAALDGSGRVK